MPRSKGQHVSCWCATAGEIIRPGGVEVVRGLLSETLLLPVYKDVCADVHAHFQRLVQPTLSAHSRQRCGVALFALCEMCMTEVHIRVIAVHDAVLGQSCALPEV